MFTRINESFIIKYILRVSPRKWGKIKMIKKLFRLFTFFIFAGAVAAGVYYFLKSREDDELFENSDNDEDYDDLDEFLKDEADDADISAERDYVSLKFDENKSSTAAV